MKFLQDDRRPENLAVIQIQPEDTGGSGLHLGHQFAPHPTTPSLSSGIPSLRKSGNKDEIMAGARRQWLFQNRLEIRRCPGSGVMPPVGHGEIEMFDARRGGLMSAPRRRDGHERE